MDINLLAQSLAVPRSLVEQTAIVRHQNHRMIAQSLQEFRSFRQEQDWPIQIALHHISQAVLARQPHEISFRCIILRCARIDLKIASGSESSFPESLRVVMFPECGENPERAFE